MRGGSCVYVQAGDSDSEQDALREEELVRLVLLRERDHHHREDAQDRPERNKNLYSR